MIWVAKGGQVFKKSVGCRIRRRETFCWWGAVARESLSALGKAGHGASPVLEPEEQSWPAVTNSTFKKLWELGGGGGKGGGGLMGSKVEGKKIRPSWEGKIKRQGIALQGKSHCTPLEALPSLPQARQVRGIRRQSPKPSGSEILVTAAAAQVWPLENNVGNNKVEQPYISISST